MAQPEQQFKNQLDLILFFFKLSLSFKQIDGLKGSGWLRDARKTTPDQTHSEVWAHGP